MSADSSSLSNGHLAQTSPRSSDVHSKLFSQRLSARLAAMILTTDRDGDILDMAEEDAQITVDHLQIALQSGQYKAHRQRIHRLLMKLSLKHNKLPASLFLRGVKFSGGDSHGSGSFADIYLGELDGAVVALKRLRVFQMVEESKREQLRRAFYHESLIWRGLDHPHVLPFIGIDNANFERSLCMVLPWMSLGNLRHAIDRLRPVLSSEDLNQQILKWIYEITLGLAYLHTEGIVHGDLRGANILVDSDKTVKLTDFGLSVFSEGTSHNYASMRGGNARWLAPEVIHPELFGLTSDRPTMASDVFGVGCVCVELCTSRAPYTGISDHQVIARVPQGLRPDRPTFSDGSPLPQALWSIMTHCWSTQASDRPTASALAKQTKDLIPGPSSDGRSFSTSYSAEEQMSHGDEQLQLHPPLLECTGCQMTFPEVFALNAHHVACRSYQDRLASSAQIASNDKTSLPLVEFFSRHFNASQTSSPRPKLGVSTYQSNTNTNVPFPSEGRHNPAERHTAIPLRSKKKSLELPDLASLAPVHTSGSPDNAYHRPRISSSTAIPASSNVLMQRDLSSRANSFSTPRPYLDLPVDELSSSSPAYPGISPRRTARPAWRPRTHLLDDPSANGRWNKPPPK